MLANNNYDTLTRFLFFERHASYGPYENRLHVFCRKERQDQTAI